MTTRRSKRKVAEDGGDEDSLAEDVVHQPGVVSNASRRRRSVIDDFDEERYDREIMFSSQVPEMTQEILPVKNSDRNNFLKLSETARNKAVTDLTRIILFKALAGEHIDRNKCIKDAGIGDGAKISTAAFVEANTRLQNQFGFELRRIPQWMDKWKSLPSKYKDRYYLVNTISYGEHSKAIHSVHKSSSIEKAFLMIVLAFVYCKGEQRSDGSRWILEKDLYTLLNRLDENIPSEPITTGSKRRSTVQSGRFDGGGGVSLTPDADGLIEKFVRRDYLMKEKAAEQTAASQNAEEGSVLYAMGPRAVMEIGRKQIVYFCAEILGQEPDPTMLAEIENDDNDENEMPLDPNV